MMNKELLLKVAGENIRQRQWYNPINDLMLRWNSI